VAPNGINLVTIPAFADISIDGEDRTAIRFIVTPR
jgi:stage V sporulation protein S